MAAAIPGTVVHDLVRKIAAESGQIRIAHPSGTLQIDIAIRPTSDGNAVDKATLLRTARKLMDGTVFVRAIASEARPETISATNKGIAYFSY